jgi:hypothetical protein
MSCHFVSIDSRLQWIGRAGCWDWPVENGQSSVIAVGNMQYHPACGFGLRGRKEQAASVSLAHYKMPKSH